MGDGIKINIVILIVIATVGFMLRLEPFGKESKLEMGYSQDSILNFTERMALNKYVSTEHIVVTEDGYVLKIFRIVKARNCHHKKKKRPVLLMHGFLQNSDAFLDAGPSASLAYLLSDACYDVWVGNQRGNNYGRKHLQWNPDHDKDFWNFSYDEIGIYDVPAIINYMIEHTDTDKINYIGFSQGGCAYFVMCSERRNFCNKTAVMIGLAPSVTLDHIESVPIRFMLRFMLHFKGILNAFGVYEILRKDDFQQNFLEYLCQITRFSWIEMVCKSGILMDSYHPGSVTSDTQRLIYSHGLAGTSLNNVVQFGQVLNSGKFKKFDHGQEINLKLYNSTETPEYKLHDVSTPVVIIHGRSDKVVSIHDSLLLTAKLPNVLEMVEVSDPDWTHLDMFYSQNIKTMIFPKINEYLNVFSEY